MTKKEKHLTRRQFLLLIGAELGVMASGKFLSHLGPKSARASSDNYTTEWAPPGINLKDHTIFWDPESGYYYLCSIHIKLPDEWEDRFVYARSRDLNDWEYLGSVLNQQTPGWWDEWCIWAPHMIKQNNEYYMFYTGVSQGICQSILMAKTANPDDLDSWQNQKTLVFQPSHDKALWQGKGYWSDCRDPMIFRWEDQFLMYYTGSDVDGNIIGIASTTNLDNPWTDLGATLKHVGSSLESPGVFEHEGYFYLFYNHTTKIPEYRTSRSPLGPWSEPFLLVPGWAHEFFHDKNGNLFTSYLTSYTITIRPVLMNNSFDPPRLFIGESLHQIHLPLIQS